MMLTRSASNELFAGKKNLALLGAFCLFLSAVEYMIPKPMPFMRIGLANLPLMIAAGFFPFSSFLILVCVKVIGQALVTGTLFSFVFLFSAAGTFFSALLMYALRRAFKKRISFIGIGTAGAFVSNTAQLALSYFFLFGENTRYIAPPFLIAGLVTGVALGAFCEAFVRKSQWYEGIFTTNHTNQHEQKREELVSEIHSPLPTPHSLTLFIIGLITMLAVVFNPITELRVLQFLLLWLLALIFKKKTNPLITILVIAFIVLFNLIIPYGYVLYSIGPFKITCGALKAGVHRAVTLQALFMLSKLTIREDLKLPGAFGSLLSESLRIFSKMTSQKKKLKGKNIFFYIDEMLLNLQP